MSESGFAEAAFLMASVFLLRSVFYSCKFNISFKCPSLISKYRNYVDFEATENSLHKIISSFRDDATEKVIRENFHDIGVMVSKYSPDKNTVNEWTSDDTSRVNWRKGIDSLIHSDPKNKPDIFSSVREVLGNFIQNGLQPARFSMHLDFCVLVGSLCKILFTCLGKFMPEITRVPKRF